MTMQMTMRKRLSRKSPMALISLVFDKKVTWKIYILSWLLQEIKLKNV